MDSRILFVQEPYGFFGEIMKSHLITWSVAWAFYRFTEGVRLVSPAVLLGFFLVREMIIELGTSHATCLRCATRRFESSRGVPSECFCPSAAVSGSVRSTGARFC